LVAQASQIRKVGPVAFDKFGIHAIDADHDHLPAVRCGTNAASGSDDQEQQQRHVTQSV
jgi:hypothetical protein